jgi:hypothetical protein
MRAMKPTSTIRGPSGPAVPRSTAPAWRHLSILLLWSVAGCGRSGDVTIRGDVRGLDSIGFLGDSLFAQADRLEQSLDSLRAVAEGRLPAGGRTEPAAVGAGRVTGGDAGTTTTGARTAAARRADDAIFGAGGATARAQARGDSIARASALRAARGAAADDRTRGDTARGVVVLVGTPPTTQTALRTASGSTMALSGIAASGMQALEGLDLMVRGVRISPRDIVVADYVVRGKDGVPAWDGRLTHSGGAWSLVLTDRSGQPRLANVPPALRSLEGARVWVTTRPGDATPVAFGVITGR